MPTGHFYELRHVTLDLAEATSEAGRLRMCYSRVLFLKRTAIALGYKIDVYVCLCDPSSIKSMPETAI